MGLQSPAGRRASFESLRPNGWGMDSEQVGAESGCLGPDSGMEEGNGKFCAPACVEQAARLG